MTEMKFAYKPSPNYHGKQSTQSIMRELTLGLLVVFICSDVYYFMQYGSAVGIRAIGLLLTAVVSALLTETIYFAVCKQDIKKGLSTSFGWITAIILTLMVQVNTSYYAVAVSTILCLVFGKLLFGGFGQNIFNPAALGRAIIMISFTTSVAADVVTGATPTATFAAAGWVTASAESFNSILAGFGGIGGLFLGTYSGAIGETSALVILLVGIYLAYRQVIDWRVPVTYLVSLFVFASIIGLMNGQTLAYPLFHLLTGGAMFGAVFMMTDPVTNPTSAPGRIIFAIGCAFFTILIRVKSTLPEGVLYSILLMNMLTPLIERCTDGQQIKQLNKNIRSALIVFVACAVLSGVCGIGLQPKDVSAAEGMGVSESMADGDYTGEAEGFGGNVSVTITVSGGQITSATITGADETPGIGQAAFADLESAIVESQGSDFDVISGATYTSQGVQKAVNAALESAGN